MNINLELPNSVYSTTTIIQTVLNIILAILEFLFLIIFIHYSHALKESIIERIIYTIIISFGICSALFMSVMSILESVNQDILSYNFVFGSLIGFITVNLIVILTCAWIIIAIYVMEDSKEKYNEIKNADRSNASNQESSKKDLPVEKSDKKISAKDKNHVPIWVCAAISMLLSWVFFFNMFFSLSSLFGWVYGPIAIIAVGPIIIAHLIADDLIENKYARILIKTLNAVLMVVAIVCSITLFERESDFWFWVLVF